MALDPLGHIRIAVSEFEKSREFYGALFAELRFKQVDKKGWVTPEGLGIWIIQAAHPDHHYVFEAPGLHHYYYAVFFSDPDGVELEVAYYYFCNVKSSLLMARWLL